MVLVNFWLALQIQFCVCLDLQVQAEKLYIEMDSIEGGILQLIADHNVEKLVMGAAPDDCYHTYESKDI